MGPRYDFSDAKVLITGGTSGIGAASAALYAKAGADVTISGTRAKASDYEDDLSAYRYLQMDIEDGASIDHATAQLDRLDILVNSAGVALPSLGFNEYEPDIFARAVNMLLIGAFRLAERAKPMLAQSPITGGGSLINICSMSSFFGIPIVPGYGAAKTGLVGLTKTLAVEWGGQNIRVNAVAAGLTRTRMTAGTFEQTAWSAPTLARTPLRRLGEPEDIANAILFLTSPAASWITGQTLPVDGGYTVSG